MRAIRTARSVSHEAIVRVTKAAPNVLEEFERTALAGNPMYNRVYLRLFIRGYAEVIGIRPDDALRAADEMLQGQYTDGLARLYLESHDEEVPEAVATAGPGIPETESEEPKAAAPGPVDARADAPTEKTAAASTAATATPPAPSKPPSPATPPPPSQPPAWPPPRPSLSPPIASGAADTLSGRAAAGIAGIIILALVALAAWFFWPDTVETTPAPAEQLVADSVPAPVPQLPARIVLGDTTSFFVIAARDTLNPIRITVDGGIRAPHWIELGDSMEFRVASELVLEMRLNAVDVSVHDVLLPTNGRDAARRLVLTKAFAQAYLDSLRTAAGPGRE